ncbi:MAG: type II toxin-antitoxin system VapC family toxin [Hydrogenothermaceae bacterium]|nr:type II toxin-antitoxin system VapC family toxin [Hydrogenothermaceae bacterium]
MENLILLDTNIIIELLKGNEKTKALLNNINSNFSVSVITQMELYYGAFNKKELIKIKKFLSEFNIFHIDEEISKKAIELIEKYSKSHNLNIPDALIASTAICKKAILLTYNLKDFQYIENLKIFKEV